MTEEKKSAERELLKLIENPQGVEEKKQSLAQEKKLGKHAKSSAPKAPRKQIDFKAVLKDRKLTIKVLAVISVLVVLNLIFNVFSEYQKLQDSKKLEVFASKTKPVLTGDVEMAKSAMDEAQPLGTLRNIFKPKPEKVEAPKEETPTVSLENYKLVGISLDPVDDTQSSAMVESVKTNITFFLRKGEILEGMEVLEIREDKLILKVQGKTVELH